MLAVWESTWDSPQLFQRVLSRECFVKKTTYVRMAALVASAGCMFQIAGCFGGDFLLRFAGAGAVVAGLTTLFGGGGN